MTIHLGHDVEIEYFGDESTSGNIVVYGFVGLKPEILDKALDELNRIKMKFNGGEDAEIHCRSLFAGDNRAKSKWSHLINNQPQFLCLEVAKAMRNLGVRGLVCQTNKVGLPKRMNLTFKNAAPVPANFSHELGDKQIQQYLYVGIMGYIHNSGQLGKVKIWVDEDITKIEWHNGKKQAKNILDLVRPTGFDPGKYRPILEVADIFVYAAARHYAMDKRKGWLTFKMIHDCFTPVILNHTFTSETWD